MSSIRRTCSPTPGHIPTFKESHCVILPSIHGWNQHRPYDVVPRGGCVSPWGVLSAYEESLIDGLMALVVDFKGGGVDSNVLISLAAREMAVASREKANATRDKTVTVREEALAGQEAHEMRQS